MPNEQPWWAGIDQTDPRFADLASRQVSAPAYTRVTALPDFMPKISDMTSELAEQYRTTSAAFDTSGFERESRGQESRVLTTALNAGNNAATDYANRARQSGGSMLGAGLVKAQAVTSARGAAGEMALQREKYITEQREKAASQATQIASTLAGLRDSYLKSLVEYSTKEDAISAEFKTNEARIAVDQNRLASELTSRNPRGSWQGTIPNNMGIASGLNPFMVNFQSGQLSTPGGGWTPGQNWNFNRRG